MLAVAGAGCSAGPLGPPGHDDPPEVGPYRIEAVLGQGGMGRVFLARDRRDAASPPVALKVLSRTGDATARTRFRRELTAARRVRGAGTARVVDGDPYADPPWLATEYIPGPTLDQLVAARGPLSAQAGAAIAVGVAEALATIHAAGIVHRDLKPANIILGPDGPRVVDFGIARIEDTTTLSVAGWTMGTPGYMAPEQIADPRAAGPPVDVFALGAVLVFATTGASPYEGGDPSAVVYRIVHGMPRTDGVPDRLRALVAACLERDQAARPGLAEIVAAGLRLVEESASERRSEEAATVPVNATIFSDITKNHGIGGESPAVAATRPPPEAVEAAGRAPSPRRRIRRGTRAALVSLVLAAVGAGAWFTVGALGRDTTAANAVPPSGASSSGRGLSASTSASVKNATKSAASAFSGGTVVTGPGCAGSPWAVFSITSGGSVETGVGGGYPGCGGTADAFRKSGETDRAGSGHADWDFDFRSAVVCTLEIYMADTDPTSGSAVYRVASDSSTRDFTINQAENKGRFVGSADLTDVAASDGVIRLTLTDISPAAGDRNHVTASAVSAQCSPR